MKITKLVTLCCQRLKYFITASAQPLYAKHLQTGQMAEACACAYLKRQGLYEVARNYRCRYGELDLIMRDQHSLVIVEVRCRNHSAFGSALESITLQKQSRIIAATRCYLAAHPQYQAVRFDVITVTNGRLAWLKHAFST